MNLPAEREGGEVRGASQHTVHRTRAKLYPFLSSLQALHSKLALQQT